MSRAAPPKLDEPTNGDPAAPRSQAASVEPACASQPPSVGHTSQPPSAEHTSQPPSAERAEPSRSAISLQHLGHRFGRRRVLHDVSLEVARGEIFGFIGPNGAGKTTTLRIIATLLEPSDGWAEVEGLDVTVDARAVRRLIGYMPDHAGVYERISVREYLDFFAAASGVRDTPVVDAVLELTELGKLEGALVASLSKGMKQRLQIARVLLNDPKVLILDEPASDLDPRARIEIRDLLLELRELGKTVFLSSHILSELGDVCTSVGILEAGRLLAAGPVGELAERLRDPGEQQRLRRAAVDEHPEERRNDTSMSSASMSSASMSSASMSSVAISSMATSPAAISTLPSSDATRGAPELDAAPAAVAGARLTRPSPAAPATVPGAAAAQLRRLELRVLGAVAAAEARARELPSVVSSHNEPGGVLHLELRGDDRQVAELVAHLVRHGIPLVTVKPERSELERIFLEVTRGSLQ